MKKILALSILCSSFSVFAMSDDDLISFCKDGVLAQIEHSRSHCTVNPESVSVLKFSNSILTHREVHFQYTASCGGNETVLQGRASYDADLHTCGILNFYMPDTGSNNPWYWDYMKNKSLGN